MPSKHLWNWQQADWPNFSYDTRHLEDAERSFFTYTGQLLGLSQHIGEDEKSRLIIEALSAEALTTSEIEGEFLNRDSVQASLQRRFGLTADSRRLPPAEDGIAGLLINLMKNFEKPLSHDQLFGWHEMLMMGRRDIEVIGAYRTHAEPMYIFSGRVDKPSIHLEAPPSGRVKDEMDQFLNWYQKTGPNGSIRLNALVRASLAHLYFVSIHPFEDGNGRISRSLVVRSLSESLGRYSLLAISETILDDRKRYYEMLERSNKSLNIQEWIDYFSAIILAAQQRSIEAFDFLIRKTKFFDRYRAVLNERQAKLLTRAFRQGTKGFEGGLSAEKYIKITKASRATATRDLTELVNLGILQRTGTGKGTRYQIVGP